MANYSITLNFFLPKKAVNLLKEVKFTGKFAFDWRAPGLLHCTVKAISLCDNIPETDLLDSWINISKKVLDKQKSLRIKIQGIGLFPSVLFAKIHSEELTELHKKLCKLLPSSQPQFENDNYVSHVSIGNLTHNSQIISDEKQDFGEFEVNEIQLVIWDLKRLNKPVVYGRFTLQNRK